MIQPKRYILMIHANGLVDERPADGNDDRDLALAEGDAGRGIIDIDIGREDLGFVFGSDAVVVLGDDSEVKLGAFARDA